jgi:hypothetical protein
MIEVVVQAAYDLFDTTVRLSVPYSDHLLVLVATAAKVQYSGFQASVEFRFKPRQISPTNPTWHPLRIKFPTEISKIPNNSFSSKSTMESDNEFERIDQRSVCSHHALYASLH